MMMMMMMMIDRLLMLTRLAPSEARISVRGARMACGHPTGCAALRARDTGPRSRRFRGLEHHRGLSVCLRLVWAWAVGVASLVSPAIAQPTAETLLANAIAYHDPEGRFLTRPHRLSFEETRPGGPDRKTEIMVDVAGERFEMVRTSVTGAGERVVVGTSSPLGCTMTLDGRSEVTDAEREKHRLNCDLFPRTRDYYTYLWALPMKLRDPGTQLGAATESEFDGRPVHGLRVTYDEDVGGDVWYFYFDRKTAALVGYRFYHDEAKNDGEYILLEGEVEAEGMRIPKRRTWYTHQGDELLGTDSLVAITAP